MVRTRSDQPLLALTLLLPVSGFWILDAYFLWQERLFRAEYDRVRQSEGTDFAMNPMLHANKPGNSRRETFWSETLVKFYGIEIAFVFILSLSLAYRSQPRSPGRLHAAADCGSARSRGRYETTFRTIRHRTAGTAELGHGAGLIWGRAILVLHVPRQTGKICQKEVELTRDLFYFGLRENYLLFDRRNEGRMRIPLDWKL